MRRKVQYLPIKEWIERGWTSYDAKYVASLIPLGELGQREEGWTMIGGTYLIADNKANRKRLGNRQRVKKSSQTRKNDTQPT